VIILTNTFNKDFRDIAIFLVLPMYYAVTIQLLTGDDVITATIAVVTR